MPRRNSQESSHTLKEATRLLDDHQQSIYVRTDRMFLGLLIIQWFAAIGIAFWISPKAWSGSVSHVHPHVWASIVLGGAITLLPVGLCISRAGQTSTRFIVAIAQMLMGSLLIHLTGGRIETHFHVFGSLAFLAVYRDWRVLITATVVVVLDHLVRGMFWPQSVYGVLSTTGWRTLEHAVWVVFEDIFLVISCVASKRDMWKQALHRARQDASENRLNSLITAISQVVWTANAVGEAKHVPDWYALTGQTADQTKGNGWTEAIHPNDRKNVLDLWQRSLSTGEPYQVEFRLRKQNGDYGHFSTRGVAVRTADGVIQEWVGLCTDISSQKASELELLKARIDLELRVEERTQQLANANSELKQEILERKQIEVALREREAELNQARDEAVESARLKSEFLANMSHEIRTPMNGVIGMTGLLLDTELSADQRDYAETIRTSGDSLLTIINDILDFSKIEAGKLQFEILDFDLSQTIEGTVELLTERAREKNLDMASLIDADVPTLLRGDAGRLRQVLTNLIGNALKFTEKGEVVIRASLESQTAAATVVRFEVSDTGIGIEEDTQRNLFQAFTQADGSTTRKYGGTGLGLAISKQLVEMMGGHIGVKSVSGEGSTFWFTAVFDTNDYVSNVVTSVQPLVNLHVLIVEDNATNRKILAQQLDSKGITHDEADSGTAALQMLTSPGCKHYDLVLLDLLMPEIDGIEVARTIRKLPSGASLPIVILSSGSNRAPELEVPDAQISEFLVKPVRRTQLFECIRRVVGERRKAVESPKPAILRTHKAPPLSNKLILLAEDNMINQKVAVRQLQRLGYRADSVADGREALEALERIPYDLVLMDCQMPEMDGYEATAEIRRREGTARHTMIVAMTAHALEGDREKCLNAGMDDYISKPVRPDELERVLSRLFDNTPSLATI